jgi:outer membrane protein
MKLQSFAFIFSVIVLITSSILNGYAQHTGTSHNTHAVKIAFVDSDSILFSLPGYKVQAKSLETHQKQLQTELERQQKEFQLKYEDYQKNEKNWTQIVLENKQKELQMLDENFREFQQKAQTSLQQKEQELLKPLFDQIKKGIEAVAKEKGYTYVVPSQVFLYAEPTADITSLVIKYLGGTPTPAPNGTQGTANK